MAILALAADLMFAARIRGTAETVGADVVLARSTRDLLDKARAALPGRVIIDLDARSGDVIELIRTLKSDDQLKDVPILAYVSHVREDAIEAARLAGADRVIARGAFSNNLPAILRG